MLLFLGATGKSAQIPLYVWLPDAMEGPTPVSALIHAATMVTAGVYMIGRNAVLFTHAPHTLAVVAGIGVATALMAGTIGLVQNDIKRVLAYSTVSQLGYMFLAMGVGAYAAGIFHLYTHAFFKALLFLGSGSVIHALAGEQDLRNMGGLKKYLPITYWTFLIGALAIAGVPLLSGFFSKDEILFRTFSGGHTLLWAIGIVTSLLTATYMFRLVFLAFHGERRHDAPAAPAHPEEEEPAAHGHGHARAGGARTWARRRPRHAARSAVVDGHPAHPAGDRIGCRGLRRRAARAQGAATRSSRSSSRASRRARSVAVAHGAAPQAAPRSRPSRCRSREPSAGRRGESHAPAADEATELTLMGISVGIAFAGIGIAFFFWQRNRQLADSLAQPVRRRLSPAAEQVLRRRALRRGDRAADQAALDRRAVEGRRRRA